MKILKLHNEVNIGKENSWSEDVLSFVHEDSLYLYKLLSARIIKFANSEILQAHSVKLDEKTRFNLEKLGMINTSKDSIVKDLKQCQNGNAQEVNLTIAPTLKCNLSCAYCFENKSNKSLSSESEDFIVDYIHEQNSKGKEIHITWYGGEPLLAMDSIRIISNKLNRKSINFSSDIITNGVCITDSILKDFCNLKINSVQITLDGCKSCHNAARSGTFSKVIRNATKIIKNNISLTVRVNCTNDNIAGIKNLLNCPDFIMLKKDKFKIYFDEIDSETSNNLKEAITQVEQQFIENNYNVKRSKLSLKVFSCSAIKDNDLCIGPELELYDCYSNFGHKEYISGNLRDSKRTAKTTYKNILPKECKSCEIAEICHCGGCPYKIKNNYIKPNPVFCEKAKSQVEERLVELIRGGK